MKRLAIVAMVCVNLALLLALLFGTAPEPAYGQYLGTNYVVVTAQVQVDWDVVYVLDLAKRRMAAFGIDKQKIRIRPIGGQRDLVRDFGRKK